MKISIDCRSPLLQKSLEKFLEGMLVPETECDIVVTDRERASSRKPLFRIGNDPRADLGKPFSRSQLMIRLEETLKRHESGSLAQALLDEEESLDERLEKAAMRFAREVVEIVREHYEKRS